MRFCYRHANRASHHVLGAVLKLLVVAYFVFGLLILFLRYAVLPNIDVYKGDIERLASRALGNKVSVARIYASWQGLRPSFFLGDVVVQGRDGRASLRLPSVSATLSWWSLAALDVRFERLELSRPDLDVTRDAAGKWYVAGILIDDRQGGDGKGAEWLLAQREVVIREGVLRWNDQLRGAAPLALTDVNLLMRNHWRRHQLGLQATPPAAFGSPVDVRADFSHPAFSQNSADVSQWKGELYAAVRDSDLAAWRAYVTYPIDLRQGHGSVRAWLSLDHAKLANVTADLTLTDTIAQLGGQLPLLELKRVNGRISARETIASGLGGGDAKLAFGALGHSVEVSDFSLETRDGLTLAPTSIAESYVPARKGEPEKTSVTARLLDLHTLFELAERLPLAASTRRLLNDFAPHGIVSDFSAQWQGAYPAIASYSVRGQFADLSLAPQPARPAQPRTASQPAQAAVPAIPGFSHLTGSIEAGDKGGHFTLASDGLVLQLPGYFTDPAMPFERLNMAASWRFLERDQLLLEIENMHFRLAGLSGSLSGKHTMPLTAQAGQSLGHVDMTGHIDYFDVATVGRYLPLQTPRLLKAWLGGALEAGYARDVALRLRGDLADFPFAGDPKKKNIDGEFKVAGKLDGVTLNYSPGDYAKDGKAPLWPLAKAIKGTIAFDRTRMEIHGDTATTAGVALANVTAIIPDLLSNDMQLDIVGSAAGALPEFIRYVNISPVAEWIDNFTEQTRTSGPARLALKLQLPLDHIIDAKVQGSLQFLNNEIVLQPDIPVMTAAVGKLNFNERGFELAGVNASLLGGPVAVSGGTARDGSTAVRAAGTVTADGVRRNYPGAAGLVERISGSTRYQLAVNIRNGHPDLLLESSLVGMGSSFPEPFHKPAASALPFRLAINGAPAGEGGVRRDDVRATLGPNMAAHYVRHKAADKDASWRIVRGGIGVNEAAPEPDHGTLVSVNLRTLNVDAWRSVIDSIGLGGSAAPPRAGAAPELRAGAAPAASDDADGLAQYLNIDMLAARAKEMTVAGKKLDNVVVGASHLRDTWQANIDSNQVSGYLTWRESSSAPGQSQGKATARLSSLIISPAAASDVTELMEGRSTSTQIPALDVVADNFELFGKKLGHLELVANNMHSGGVREWRINKLSLVNPDAQLQMTGKWIGGSGPDSGTNLHYNLDLRDAGKLLERFGFAHVMRAGSGKLDGDLSWKGVPFSLDIPTMAGKINLNVGAGQFLKVEPGAAKLLGVLNLQALPHLLKLDFRDIFSEGLAFDGISATATINSGVVKTNNLKMRSVAATVLMDGSADLGKESQNLRVVVIPEFNLGTGSLVYMLAVNPVVGLGSYLAQLFIRAPVMKALTYQYQITGPWKEPVVTKIATEFANVPDADLPSGTPAAPAAPGMTPVVAPVSDKVRGRTR